MKNKPISEIRIGTVKAAIWQNKTGEIIRHNVTFTRIYKDGEPHLQGWRRVEEHRQLRS